MGAVVLRFRASRQAADDGKPHVVLVDMLKTMHKASQTMKQAVGSECPVFQDSILWPFWLNKGCSKH